MVQSNLIDTPVIFLLNLKEEFSKKNGCSLVCTYVDPAQERSSKREERSEPGEDESDCIADLCQVCTAVRVVEQSEEEGGERSDHPSDDGGDDQDGVGGGGRLSGRSYRENLNLGQFVTV